MCLALERTLHTTSRHTQKILERIQAWATKKVQEVKGAPGEATAELILSMCSIVHIFKTIDYLEGLDVQGRKYDSHVTEYGSWWLRCKPVISACPRFGINME